MSAHTVVAAAVFTTAVVTQGSEKCSRHFINETYLLGFCGFADSTIVGLKWRSRWRQRGSSLVRMCCNWLRSPTQHSQLDHHFPNLQDFNAFGGCVTYQIWKTGCVPAREAAPAA